MATYTTPSGNVSALYDHITKQAHVLIGGTTGSGKSVLVRGILNTLLYRPFCDCPGSAEFILIDPKGTELCLYKGAPHCIRYASAASAGDMLSALRLASGIVDERFAKMQRDPSLMDENHYYNGSDIWIVIDELADLMLSADTAEVKRLIQHIGQIGRASRCNLLAATQCPLTSVIPTPIKCNFNAILALRTRSAQDSRNIIGCKGAEAFPKFGKALYQNPDDTEILTVNVPYTDEAETRRLVDHWRAQFSARELRESDRLIEVPSQRTESSNSALNASGHSLCHRIGNRLKTLVSALVIGYTVFSLLM